MCGSRVMAEGAGAPPAVTTAGIWTESRAPYASVAFAATVNWPGVAGAVHSAVPPPVSTMDPAVALHVNVTPVLPETVVCTAMVRVWPGVAVSGFGVNPVMAKGVAMGATISMADRRFRRGPTALLVEIASAVLIRIFRTCCGVSEELADRRRPAAPDTNAAARDVPPVRVYVAPAFVEYMDWPGAHILTTGP